MYQNPNLIEYLLRHTYPDFHLRTQAAAAAALASVPISSQAEVQPAVAATATKPFSQPVKPSALRPEDRKQQDLLYTLQGQPTGSVWTGCTSNAFPLS